MLSCGIVLRLSNSVLFFRLYFTLPSWASASTQINSNKIMDSEKRKLERQRIEAFNLKEYRKQQDELQKRQDRKDNFITYAIISAAFAVVFGVAIFCVWLAETSIYASVGTFIGFGFTCVMVILTLIYSDKRKRNG